MLIRRISVVLIVLVLLLSPNLVQASSTNPPQPSGAPNGGWLEQVDVIGVGSVDIKNKLESGVIDVYDSLGDVALYQDLTSAGYKTTTAPGIYYNLIINTYGPTFSTGQPNPFYFAKVREALNWLIDRDTLAQNLATGLGIGMPTAITNPSLDFFRNFRTIDALNVKYAFKPDFAKTVIETELIAQGYSKVGGYWAYGGTVSNLVFIIRNDGDGNRIDVGDHIADQLEFAGFKVERQYKNSAEASPIWIGSNPTEGLWNIYTGGWISPTFLRDSGSALQEFYSPDSIQGLPFMQYYTNTPSFEDNMAILADHSYSSLDERQTVFTDALKQSLQSSNQVFLLQTYNYYPYRSTLSISSDVHAGIYASELLPYVINTSETIKTAKLGTLDLFYEAWNPIAGSGIPYDTHAQQFMWGYPLLLSPRNGLNLNNRDVTAQVIAQTKLPITNSSDWVSLSFADSIVVPDDAWVDWNVSTQSWITAVEKHATGTLTANLKSVITYPEDLYDTVKWHDGSPLSVADFVAAMILPFDRASSDSPYYDEYAVKPNLVAYRIVETKPLTIEYYTNDWDLDAENNVHSFWPAGDYGELPWHTLSLGLQAEASKDLAFSAFKAVDNSVEQTNYAFGPSIPVLKSILDVGDIEIPFDNVLNSYLLPTERAVRTEYLQTFCTEYGHMHLGTGPYYLYNAEPTSNQATFKNNADYPEPAGKWDEFNDNQTPTLTVDQAVASPGSGFNFTGTGYTIYSVQGINFTPNTVTGDVVNSGSIISADNNIIGREIPDEQGKIYFSIQTTFVSPTGTINVSTSSDPLQTVQVVIDKNAPLNPNPPIGFVYLPLGTFTYLPAILR